MDQPRYFPPPGEFGPPPASGPTRSRRSWVLLAVAVALLVAGGAVLAVVLLADGEQGSPGESAPTDAPREEFCAAMRELDVVSGEVPGQATVDAYADGLAGTGTPEGIPGDARDGFELLVDTLDGLEVTEASSSMARELGSQLMSPEFLAFARYYAETCR